MTRPITGIGTLRSGPCQQFRSKALFGAAVLTVFGAVLSAGSAEAFQSTNCLALADLTMGNTKITNIKCTGDVENSASAVISLDEITADLEYSFIGNLFGGSLSGTIAYDIEIFLGDNIFQTVQLTSDGSSGSVYDVTKTVSWLGGSMMLATDESDEEPVLPIPALLNLQKLSILDSWTATTGKVQVVKNNFTQAPAQAPSSVPGPLPIIGAAAAFGMSRKLRSRIKQASISL